MSNYNLPVNKAKHLKYKFGWLPDLPDARDYIYQPPLKVGSASELPSKVDLRNICSPVQDQGSLGCCTAHALLAAFECCKKVQGQKTKRLSRLFVYYNERVMMNTVMSDSGAYLRDGVKTLNKQGVCFEKDWTYSKSTARSRSSPIGRSVLPEETVFTTIRYNEKALISQRFLSCRKKSNIWSAY